MQALVWLALYSTFGIARVGYWFFDLSDIAYYYEEGALRIAQGLVPFRDFLLVYPPLFAPLVVLPGVNVSEKTYFFRFAFLMIASMTAACAVTALAVRDREARWRPYVVAAVFAACTLVLGPITANRYDATVALVLALTLFFMARARWLAVAVTIGVGFALKITPAVLLPLALVLAPRNQWWRMLAGFSAAAVIPFLLVLGSGHDAATNLSEMLAYHLGRPLETESVLATPLWIGRLLGLTTVQVGVVAGSQSIVSATSTLIAKGSVGVLVAALGGVLALVWRRREAIVANVELQFLAVLATLLASLVGSKVLSPQYFVWIIPAVALVAIDRRVLGALLAVVLLLTQVEFPANYWAFAQFQQPGAVAIVVIRNLVLVAAFALSLWHLWRIPEPTPSRAKGRVRKR